jgi:DHA2 family multidrug resistance protein-like MFS transporter
MVTTPDGLPERERKWAFATIALALTMAVLDGSIVNVALPNIARDLRVEPASVIWVINAYQLAIVAALLPLAFLGETIGYKRVYWTGLAVFTVGSLGCALSGSLSLLVAARILLRFGAAGIMSVNSALVRFIYPQAMLGRGLGNNALVVALSSAAGPTIAAAILSLGSWPWLFLVNVPIGALALVIAARTLPETPKRPRRFDWLSAGLNALTFGLLIMGIDGISNAPSLTIPMIELAGGAAIGVRSYGTSSGSPPRCYPSTSCAFPCLRSQCLPLSQPLRRRASRSSPCPSTCRMSPDVARSRRAC